ncbi:MAG: hypothetical protein JXB07_09020 [Anaerolineae bacterium]|nr:hypothetical protein [Anaerolineae bacterium]
MDDKKHIREFAQMLDRLVEGENVAAGENLDPGMVDIARTLATTDLSDLSRNREAIRHQLGQRRATGQTTRRPEHGTPLLVAFSMGFVTVAALVLVGFVLILPLARQLMTGHSIAIGSDSTPTPFLIVEQYPTLPAGITSIPEHIDYVVAVPGNVGTIQQFIASLPSEEGLTSHIIQVTVDIPLAEGEAGHRRIEYALVCSGAGAENLRWGAWGLPPATLSCGSIAQSDELLWSQNTVYFIIEIPAESVTNVTYTFAVKVSG